MDGTSVQLLYYSTTNYTSPVPDILPNLTSPAGIGIVVAISGNVLISLALNLQKLAHRKVELARARKSREHQDIPTSNGVSSSSRPINLRERGHADEGNQYGTRLSEEPEDIFSVGTETQHLLSPIRRDYSGLPSTTASRPNRNLFSRIFPFQTRKPRSNPVHTTDSEQPFEGASDVLHTPSRAANGAQANSKLETKLVGGNESDYLRSKLWWLGFVLMNVGEIGNFISYGFAPASVVAPLGTFALIANCFFAPLMQGERFRKMDLLGVVIAVLGAVTVVLSCNTSDVRLDPDALIQHISKRSFLFFSCVYVVSAIVLAGLSENKTGRDWVFVDVGLCALFGGFTVLSTKAISGLLTLEWLVMFTQWITYPILLILIGTGVGQIRYLNRALMRFDSKVVIPIQFVLFTLSAIVGSAVLYGDFEKASVPQLLNFFYGCTATFVGVFIIAWVPSTEDDEDERQDDVPDDEGETASAVMGSEGGRSVVGDRPGFGSIGRRNRVRVLSHVGAGDAISLRKRKSIVSMAVSPAQQLLLVHTPARDMPDRRYHDEDDVERNPIETPDSYRRRTISWFGEDLRRNNTRDSSVGARDRNGPPTSPPGRPT